MPRGRKAASTPAGGRKDRQRVQAGDRYEPGRRRVALILAAAESTLIDGGYAQLTLRRVATEAGLPLRHLQYYFPTKEELLRALCEAICNDYIAKCDAIASEAAGSPTAQFLACIDFLIEDNRDPASNTIFFELWALACHDPHAKVVVARLYSHYRAYVAKLIASMRRTLPGETVELRALQIVALIEGLSLFIGRDKPRLAAVRGLAEDARANILRIATAA